MPPLTALRKLPESITRYDLAAALRVSDRTVDAWVKRGILPLPMKLNHLKRWDRDQVIAHLSRLATEQAKAEAV